MIRFDRTYEELKPGTNRNDNRSSAAASFDRTYEELKPRCRRSAGRTSRMF